MQSLTARIILCFSIALLLGGCAGGGSSSGDDIVPRGKILACKSGDTQIESASQCLQDDAACYQKADGAWCTGPRGNVCPAAANIECLTRLMAMMVYQHLCESMF